MAREEFGLRGDLNSDCGSVLPLTRALAGMKGVHFLRDPTRGGIATVTHEITEATGLGVRLRQENIPVSEPVRGVCEILGYDPLYLASEGRCVAVTAPEVAQDVLKLWQGVNEGRGAAIVGGVEKGHVDVRLETPIGGERILQELEDDPLPRIC